MNYKSKRSSFKRAVSLVLVLLILVGLSPNVSYAATTFTPRLTAPSYDDPDYIHVSHNGNNRAYNVPGNNSVLPNCVGYAWGRAYEILGRDPKLSVGHAKTMYTRTWDGFERNPNVPKVGAIACWDGIIWGHVAVVEKVNGNRVTLSQSSWGGPRFSLRRNIIAPKKGDSFSYWTSDGRFEKCTFQGYIYIGDFASASNVPPSATSSVSLSPDNRAVGESVTASWSVVSGASSYDVTLVCTNNSAYNQTKAGIKSTKQTFIPRMPGTYKVSVIAKNSAGSSAAKMSGTITVHPNKMVTFVDWNGNTLKSQVVKYGGNAKAPMAPSRQGYTFQGWDKGFTNVKTDLTVTANYSINKYDVIFVGKDNQVLSSQYIAYGSAATAPTPPTVANYSFVKWDSDAYLDVRKPLRITASYRWTNPDLPNAAQITSAIRTSDGSGYNVAVKLTNSPIQNTKGRVIVALKNDLGKMVQSETATYYLNELSSASKNIFVPYTGVATVAEVAVVGILENGNTGVPLAAKATKQVDLGLAWSDWSTAQPPSGNNIIRESRTEYRYRNKLTTTRTTTYPTTTTALAGWQLVNSAITSWTPWSGWSNTRQSTAPGKQENSRTIPARYKTVYKYYRYKYWNTSAHTWYYTYAYNLQANPGGAVRHDIALDYQLGRRAVWSGHQAYGTYNYQNTGGTNMWFYNGTGTVQTAPAYNQYQYRNARYTHTFKKWDNWSNWSASSVTPISGSREVETRTVYRYKSNVTADLQDNSGIQKTISGQLDVANKLATLLVFRKTNVDPTASQLEYVAQAQLSPTGQYSFTFKTKEEPTVETGDFIVMLAVEGGKAPIYIDKFAAPLPTYQVQFIDEDGTVISEQQVSQGESATLPDAPTKDGYDFTGWDANTTNISSNVTAQAQYQPKVYNVVFVDWNAEFVEVAQYNHGDVISNENMPTRKGYTFAQWQDESDQVASEVTSDMVLTAKYDKNLYTVKFLDWDDNVISEQVIPYGESATIPELDDPDNGMKFGGYGDVEAAYVVEAERTFRPVAIFAETVAMPVADVTSDYYNSEQTVTISCATEGARIFYTTDGTVPRFEKRHNDENGTTETIINPDQKEYLGPITIDKNTVLIAIAYKDAMNDSDWLIEEYMFGDAPVEQVAQVTATPDSSTIEAGTKITLATTTEDAIIRYTTDGTTPNDSSPIYTSPIEINETMTLKAQAIKSGLIDSDVATFEYSIVANDQPSITIGSKTAKAGETFKLPISLSNSKAIAGIEFNVNYDPAVLTLDSVEAVDGSQTGLETILPSTTSSGAFYAFNVAGLEPVTYNGKLMEMTFTLADDAEADTTTAVTLQNVVAPTVDDSLVDYQPVNGIVKISNIIYGDFTGDGRITANDVMWIRRYISAGKSVAKMLAEITGPTPASSFVEEAVDFTANGLVNGADVIWLRRFISAGRNLAGMLIQYPDAPDFSHLE